MGSRLKLELYKEVLAHCHSISEKSIGDRRGLIPCFQHEKILRAIKKSQGRVVYVDVRYPRTPREVWDVRQEVSSLVFYLATRFHHFHDFPIEELCLAMVFQVGENTEAILKDVLQYEICIIMRLIYSFWRIACNI